MVGEFASHGHTVCGCARTPTAIDELREQFPAPHRFEVVDVADDTAVKDWSHQVLDEIGTPRWVINNAGLINGNAPLWNISGDEFATVVDVNIKGTFHVLRHFLPAMIRQGDGVIVQHEFDLGTYDISRSCTLLCNEMGHRRIDSGISLGAS